MIPDVEFFAIQQNLSTQAAAGVPRSNQEQFWKVIQTIQSVDLVGIENRERSKHGYKMISLEFGRPTGGRTLSIQIFLDRRHVHLFEIHVGHDNLIARLAFKEDAEQMTTLLDIMRERVGQMVDRNIRAAGSSTNLTSPQKSCQEII